MIIVLCGVRGSGKDTIGDYLAEGHCGPFEKYAFATPLKKMVKIAFPAFTDTDLYGPSKFREHEYEQYPLTSCPWCGGGITYDKYDNRGGEFKLMPADQIDTHRRCMTVPEHDWLPEFLSPRVALQTLGTEWGRRLYKDVWIDAAFGHIRKEGVFRDITYMGSPAPLLPRNTSWVITDGRFRNEVQRSRELGGIAVQLTRGLKESTDPHPSEAELRTMKPEEFDYTFDNAELSLEKLPEKVDALVNHIIDKLNRK